MKRLFAVVALLVISVSAFALGGVMSGSKGDVKVIKTEYFDIIYPEDCIEDALKIAKVCDGYYLELTEKFGYEPYQRFPVSITRQVESPNAYFSLGPYNHIVLFVAEEIPELDMYENTLEKIFYHELTHAVSLNSKHPFWRGMAFFADILTPSGLSLTSFWYEGATVSYESAERGGRMNDPFFTQIVVESKLKQLCGEKDFPSWRDVTGAKDVFPGGTDAYAFGGAFALYLQDTYGIEKYAEFWKRAGTFTTLSFCAGVFKKTYGIKLDDAWNDFYEAIPVPQGELSRRKELFAKKSLISKKDSLIRVADSFYDRETGKTHMVWADSTASSIFYDGKKILKCKSVNNLRFTPDGQSVYVNVLVERSNTKSEDFCLNLETKKIEKLPHSKDRFDVTQNARIVKNHLDWKICYTAGEKTAEYDFGDTSIHSLHQEYIDEQKAVFVFTWAKLVEGGLFKNEFVLPQPGKIEIDLNTLNAKVYTAPDFNYVGLESVIPYDGKYAVNTYEFDSRPLRSVNIEWVEQSSFDLSSSPQNEEQKNVNDIATAEISEKEAGLNVSGYNPLKYYVNGVKIPYGLASVYDKDFNISDSCWLGAAFVSGNPWLDKMLTVSGGWNPFIKTGAVSGQLNGGDSLFSWSISGSSAFDGCGFLQGYGQTSAKLGLWRGRISSLNAGASLSGLYGSVIDDEKTVKVNEDGYAYKAHVSMDFSNVHKYQPGYGQYLGLWISPFVDAYNNNLFNAGAGAGLRIPGPLPLKLSGYLFPAVDTFANCSAGLQLWDFEIQKGIPAVSLYAYRVVLNLLYTGKISYVQNESWDIKRADQIAKNINSDDYSDCLNLSCDFYFGPNTSYYASGAMIISICTEVNYHFFGDKKGKVTYGIYPKIDL